MGYNINKKSKKKNRLYYAINISFDLIGEGKHDFILLLIADNRIIPDTKTATIIFNYLLQESL